MSVIIAETGKDHLFNYKDMRSIFETGTLSQPLSPDTKLQQLSEEDYGEMVAEVFARFTDIDN